MKVQPSTTFTFRAAICLTCFFFFSYKEMLELYGYILSMIQLGSSCPCLTCILF